MLWIRNNFITAPDPDPTFQSFRIGMRPLIKGHVKKDEIQVYISSYTMTLKLQFTYPKASKNDVQVTEEASARKRKHQNTSKHEIYFFLLYWAIFALLDPDPEYES